MTETAKRAPGTTVGFDLTVANADEVRDCYAAVADLGGSLRRCADLGGSVLTPIKGDADSGRYCGIRDPAGAVLALMQVAAEA